MNLTLKQRLFYFSPALLCFCLPFGSLLLSGIIIFWTIISFFNINKEQFKKGISNKHFWLLLSYFLYTAISALFSTNKPEALFNVEVKLSFILFPFFFFCFKWPIQIIKRCLVSFVSGCFFACIALILRACYYASKGNFDYFFYTQFSIFIHASYFAMYLILAVTLLLLAYPKWFYSQKSVTYFSYFFILIFITTIFLCSSKLGIISFFISVPLILIYKNRSYLNFKKIFYLIVGIFMIGVIGFKSFPESFNRLSSLTSISTTSLDKTSSESTTVRILIWGECLQLIQGNFLLGTGVGDANDALYNAYKTKGLSGALAHKLNAHNQFFQSFIGLGIIGFIILVLLTFGYFIRSILRKHFFLFLFSLLIVLNFLVESMLQTSAGVLFFVFFLCLFNLVSTEEIINEI